MRSHSPWVVLLFAILPSGVTPVAAQGPCSSPSQRAFDFWRGDWDVFDADDPTRLVAHARVDTILGGCVLREIYDGKNGLSGQSFSMYDAPRRAWHQSWVTNRGQLLLLDGGIQADRMVLTGTQHGADGTATLIRGEWWITDEGVREKAETSADRGTTWTPLFDLVFRASAKRTLPTGR